MKNKKNSKSAFYNCLVLIYRMKINSSFKEIHIKIFNSGKLEIPGIQTNEMLERSINVVIEQLSPYINSPIFELNEREKLFWLTLISHVTITLIVGNCSNFLK